MEQLFTILFTNQMICSKYACILIVLVPFSAYAEFFRVCRLFLHSYFEYCAMTVLTIIFCFLKRCKIRLYLLCSVLIDNKFTDIFINTTEFIIKAFSLQNMNKIFIFNKSIFIHLLKNGHWYSIIEIMVLPSSLALIRKPRCI